jgi:hypothetical protein
LLPKNNYTNIVSQKPLPDKFFDVQHRVEGKDAEMEKETRNDGSAIMRAYKSIRIEER